MVRRGGSYFVDGISVLVLGEPEVGWGQVAPGETRPLDGAAPVEFPVGEAEDDDVGEPDLKCRQKKFVTVAGATLDEGTNQQDERHEVADADDSRPKPRIGAVTRSSGGRGDAD